MTQSLRERLRRLRHVALDMDGTIYRGDSLFPYTKPFLRLLDRLGIGYTLLTNNSSRSIRDYLAHLRHLGLQTTADQIHTSTLATIAHIRRHLPSTRRLFVLGTPSMREELQEAGFCLAGNDVDDPPDAVLVGFDMTLTFERLCLAGYWLSRGKLFLATHPDRVCPTDKPTLLVDCGSICACLTHATGRTPIVLGKPDPAMLQEVFQRHSVPMDGLAMVGDRLSTDIALAHNAGAFGVLVLTGESTAAEAHSSPHPPDLIVPRLQEFGDLLAQAKDGVF